jgi:carboxylesterase
MTPIPLPAYLPGAEPYFQRGDAHAEVGCLVMHGFNSSPGEVKWLARHLAKAGFTVYAPRLFAHGGRYQDMRRARWGDWYLTACDALAVLTAQCERVVVIGHSMGGMLSLLLASDDSQRAKIAGVCVMGTPITLEAFTTRYARYLKFAMPYTDQTDRSPLDGLMREEQGRRGEPVIGRIRYNRWSTGAVAELYALSGVVRSRLPLITLPLLLIYSTADTTVSMEQYAILTQNIATSDVEQRIVHQSGHNLPVDSERDPIFEWITVFAGRFT